MQWLLPKRGPEKGPEKGPGVVKSPLRYPIVDLRRGRQPAGLSHDHRQQRHGDQRQPHGQHSGLPGKALGNYVPDGQIGGDVFRNSTGILPSSPGQVWYEADIGLANTMSRANQLGTRLLYSNDGLLYVTPDHYQTVSPIGTWK